MSRQFDVQRTKTKPRVFMTALTIAAAIATGCVSEEAGGLSAVASSALPPEEQTLRDAATLAVFVDLPADSVVASPIHISGTADSRFFWEGVFPVRLLGANGCVLGEAPAIPTGDWMVPGQIAFRSTLFFSAAPGSSAVLVFQEDIVGEDPLAPLEVRTLVKIAGTLAPDRPDPDPSDCPTTDDGDAG